VFDAVQRDIEAELAATNATLEIRVGEWPLEVEQRNVMRTRVSQAIKSAVAAGSEQLIGLPELGPGVTGTVRPQGQEFLGLSRVTVRHGSLVASDDYLVHLKGQMEPFRDEAPLWFVPAMRIGVAVGEIAQKSSIPALSLTSRSGLE
jgi:hypothetical protein